MSRAIYTLYRGDEVIGTGTISELAELWGVKKDTMHWYATPSARKRGNIVAIYSDRV